MPITGIDHDKCIKCYNCLDACTDPGAYIQLDEEKDEIVFEDSNFGCIKCGQCVAQCPEDAILYEDMGEAFTFDKINDLPGLIDYDTLFNFMAANRSIRFYKDKKVPQELLDKVIDAMNRAPTAANMRSEKFYIVSDSEKIKALSDAIYEEFLKDPSEKEHWQERKENYGRTSREPVFYNAPHAILVSSNFNMMMEGFNIGNIVTYGRLAAQSLGLGTCWIGYVTMANEKNPKIAKIVNARGKIIGAFTIGYPDVKFYRVPPRSEKRVKIID
ncbi:MAG: 4Fe-4S dicluster domain-containing protein [Candidatus Lokiarchaeota archaeon]|nr:4Fe-4S dicluster domain-containing protein [Candidatus Lokiarchaeota archaeon]MBD3341137.1 4Fe-4S dicluster domain-containing protein [Candidatus Lokiarchaeota archaeon]